MHRRAAANIGQVRFRAVTESRNVAVRRVRAIFPSINAAGGDGCEHNNTDKDAVFPERFSTSSKQLDVVGV